MKTIHYSFGINSYDSDTRKLVIGLYLSATDALKVFGINFRFFFDSRILQNMQILIPGYREYNRTANQSTNGWKNLGSTGSITYVNTAIEALSTDVVEISGDKKQIAELTFDLKQEVSGEVFPALIFDKQMEVLKGGFAFPTQARLLATEIKGTAQDGTILTGPTYAVCDHLNWAQMNIKAPWGVQINEESINA